MIRARSRLEAPSAMSDRISRSIDTVGSPDSIFATLDWLDCTAIAKSCCVSRFRTRRALSPSASLRRSSISAASSGDRFRNSLASPSFQPRFASLALLLARIVILLKTSLAVRDHVPGRGARLLGKHRPYHNRVSVRPINDSPIGRLVSDAQLMTSPSDSWQGSGMRHAQRFATLKPSKQHSRLNPSFGTEGRGLNLPVQPHQRLIDRGHRRHYMSVLTYCQFEFGNLTTCMDSSCK